MVCQRCGADVVPGAKRCGSCGTPVEGAVGNDEPTVVLPEGAGQHQPTMRMPAATYQPTQALPPTAYPPPDQYTQDPYGQYPPQGQYPPPGGRRPENDRNNQTPLYIAAAVLAVVLAVLLTYLLTRPDENPATVTPTDSATPSATPSETPKATTEPDPGAGSDNLLNAARKFDGPPGSGFELLPTGKIVRYDIDKLRDGDWNSVWRTQGDASGEDIEARWSEPVWIHELQLTNGYAVEDEALQDRYEAERRITRITIEVDGDSVGTYTLNEDPKIQTITLSQPVQGKRLEVNIEATTDPGDPNQDFTAMTELVVR